MTCDLVALCIDACDPVVVAGFWSGLLGWDMLDDGDGLALLPHDDTGFRLRIRPTDRPKDGPNHVHPDLTSTSLADQQRTVARALALGGRHLDVGQRGDEGHVVLADPEGNELCVIEPDNAFLADCGFLGALAGDGSQQGGYFWADALGWPLVWDQDPETAIRSPHGGPKLTWGGPPLQPKTGKHRVHLDLAPSAGSDRATEVERLLALGATRTDIAQGDADRDVLLDPDGHEFCVADAHRSR